MRIALPPERVDDHFNLSKQAAVFASVVDHDQDTLVPRTAGSDEDLRAALCLAHSPEYVGGVLRGELTNGFGNWAPHITAHAWQSVACLYAAARAAVAAPQGAQVAFAPASGFHHAKHSSNSGDCAFNGLMAVALDFIQRGLSPRGVAIIDGDGPYGDGTEDILSRQTGPGARLIKHCSLSRSSVYGSPYIASVILAAALGAMAKAPPSLVIYQAGAGSHKADPYKAGYLNDTQWYRRDLKVFKWCRDHAVPVVWCLAGGCNGLKTINLHGGTFGTALQVYEPGSTRLIFGLKHSLDMAGS